MKNNNTTTHRRFLSLILLLPMGAVLTACNSQKGGGFFQSEAEIVLVVLLAIAVIAYIVYLIQRRRLKEAQEEQEVMMEIRRQELRRLARERYEQWIQDYKTANGEPDIVFVNEDYDLDRLLIFNSNTGTIYIKGKSHPYREILGYKIEDKQRVIPGEVTEVATISTSRIFERAVVGSIFHKDGALIGALTAPRETRRFEEEDTIIHNYVLTINFNDLSCPMARYEIGEDEEIAEEVNARLNIIVERNKIR